MGIFLQPLDKDGKPVGPAKHVETAEVGKIVLDTFDALGAEDIPTESISTKEGLELYFASDDGKTLRHSTKKEFDDMKKELGFDGN